MRCISCGSENDSASRFCYKCGTELTVNMKRLDRKTKSKKKIITILICAVLAIVLVAVAFGFVLNQKAKAKIEKEAFLQNAVKSSSVINCDGYSIRVPESWVGHYTVEKSDDSDKVDLMYAKINEDESKVDKALLCTVKHYTDMSYYRDNEGQDITFLAWKGKDVYVLVYPNKTKGFDDEYYRLQQGIDEITLEPQNGTEKYANEYILPNVAYVRMTKDDVAAMTDFQLNYGANEIYAQHGRLFETDAYQQYFDNTSWYSWSYFPSEDFDDDKNLNANCNNKLNIDS